MFALARPLVEFVIAGGKFSHSDALLTAIYFAIFTLSLPLWASQSIYSRAFYAAGETRAPMVWGTVITIASLPIYWGMNRRFGVIGLAWASNLAILAQTVMLATMAHHRRLVRLSGLDGPELLRSLLAAAISFVGVHFVVRLLPVPGGHWGALILLLAGGAAWALLAFLSLHLSGSSLPAQIRRRRV